MNIQTKYEDVVANLDAALGREAALREELESIKASVDGYDSPEHAAQVADELGHQCNILQQRLTVAEQRVQRMVECSKGQDSVATGYLSDILALLKPAAEHTKICPNCKICMGSPDFPENCLINGIKP